MRGAQGGSEAALAELFRLHWRRAHRAAYLVVHDAAAAEDIAQEAFLAAIRNLDRFDRRRPFGPWLHRIVVNRAIDWARARTLRAEVELGESLAAHSEPAAGLPALVRALGALPPEQRECVELAFFGGLTHTQIAERLQAPLGTVKSRILLGMNKLRQSLASYS